MGKQSLASNSGQEDKDPIWQGLRSNLSGQALSVGRASSRSSRGHNRHRVHLAWLKSSTCREGNRDSGTRGMHSCQGCSTEPCTQLGLSNLLHTNGLLGNQYNHL